MADIAVRPVRAGMKLPPHPVAGLLPDKGGMWPEDQFTFRRIQDRDIERVADAPTPTTAVVEGAELVEAAGAAPAPSESADLSASPRRR